MSDAELASLARRTLHLNAAGDSIETAILLDNEIDHSTPTKPRSERPRVGSIMHGHIDREEVLSQLRKRGFVLGKAAADGNCAQRSALCSSGELTAEKAAATADAGTLDLLRSQRHRIVNCVTGDAIKYGVPMSVRRANLDIHATAMDSFRSLGHWNDSGSAFILFLFGLADDLDKPIVVLTRSTSGYADPVCVYLKSMDHDEPVSSGQHNAGLFEYIRFADVIQWLDTWLDEVPNSSADTAAKDRSASSTPFALVDFVPGHYQPFIFAAGRLGGSRR